MGNPTEQQLAAITAPVGSNIVLEAVPGSGKTFTISHRIKYLVDNGIDPAKILVATFSRSQAEDMALRIFERFPELKDTPLATGFNGLGQITTIHASAKRLLEEFYPRYKNLQIAQSYHERGIIEKEVERLHWVYWNSRTNKEELMGWQSILYWINRAKANFVKWEQSALVTFIKGELAVISDPEARNFAIVAVRYQEELARYRGGPFWTFADMMYECEKNLINDPEFQKHCHDRFSHILLDETQDTNSQAMRIVENINPTAVFVVGDSDQCLYRFNLAAPEINLREGFDAVFGGTRFGMSTNFRSDRIILTRAERLIEHNYTDANRKYYKRIEAREGAKEGADLRFDWFIDPEEEAREVVKTISEKLEAGAQVGDFFIMSRTNAQLAYIELALLRRNIPFVNLGISSFFNRRVPRIAVEHMRLVVDPSNWDAFQYVHNIASRNMWSKKGYSPTRWLGRKFTERINKNADDLIDEADAHMYDLNQKGWEQWEKGVRDLVDTFETLGKFGETSNAVSLLAELWSLVLEAWIADDYGVEDDASESAIEDFQVMLDIAQNLTVAEFIKYVDQLQATKDVKPEDMTDYVLIGTIYRFKGLERNTVFVIGMSELLLPHKFSIGHIPPTDGLPLPSVSTIWDERNLAYVAVTRAKHECYLSGVATYPTSKDPFMPSRFIKELGLVLPEQEQKVQLGSNSDDKEGKDVEVARVLEVGRENGSGDSEEVRNDALGSSPVGSSGRSIGDLRCETGSSDPH